MRAGKIAVIADIADIGPFNHRGHRGTQSKSISQGGTSVILRVLCGKGFSDGGDGGDLAAAL